jgi:hypothetical protein
MLFQLKSYLQFLWYSKNEHAVHSPFVFNLITKSFYDRKIKPEYSLIKQCQKDYLQNENSNKTVHLSFKSATLLFRLADYFKPSRILEVGNEESMATVAMALGYPEATKTNFEVVFKKNLASSSELDKHRIPVLEKLTAGIENREIASSKNFATFSDNNYQFIYFSEKITTEELLLSFEFITSNVTNNLICIIHNIHSSKVRQETWELIKNDPQVTVSIDVFTFGFVFFRKEQPKQHFYIRI